MMLEQLHLTDEQTEKLESIARQDGITVAEVVLRAVDELLEARKRKRDELWERSMGLSGKYRSGLPDLSERHDDYLNEDYW